MIEDVIIGIFLGGFLIAGPQVGWKLFVYRRKLTMASRLIKERLNVDLEEFGKKKREIKKEFA